MSIEIDTATDHVDLFDRLIAFLTLGVTSSGPDWELLRQSTDNMALFRAPGLSGTEQIHIGISLNANVGADAYSLGFWMFRSYNELVGDFEQPGHSGLGYLPIWNTTMPYWFVANGQRLIVTTKVSTVYPSGYIGKFLPYGTPGEYPQPYYIGMVTPSSSTRWSTTDEGNRNFWDPGTEGNMLNPNGQWVPVQNWWEQSGETGMTTGNYIWPFRSYVTNANSSTRYRELRENLDGTYSAMPLVINGVSPGNDIYGELDGAYAVSGFNNATENLIDIDGDDYLVVQNLHRTARYYYAGIKLT